MFIWHLWRKVENLIIFSVCLQASGRTSKVTLVTPYLSAEFSWWFIESSNGGVMTIRAWIKSVRLCYITFYKLNCIAKWSYILRDYYCVKVKTWFAVTLRYFQVCVQWCWIFVVQTQKTTRSILMVKRGIYLHYF